MIDAILTRPGTTLGVAALATLLLGTALPRLRFDNTPETWLPATGSERQEYTRYRERFGDDALILAFTANARFEDPIWRAAFGALQDELRALPELRSVEASDAVGSTAGRSPGFASPLAPYLQSRDGTYAAIALLPDSALSVAERSLLVETIEQTLSARRSTLGPLHLAGADVITHDLDRGSKRSLLWLSPFVFALMCLVFFTASRSLRAVGAMLLAVILAGVWTLALMALTERTLNLIAVVIPAILAVVTVAQATHLLSRFLSVECRGDDPRERNSRVGWWRQAMVATWRPCLLSAATTAAGFASVGVSEIPPVRDLGIFTAIGVMFSFALTFSVVPALLLLSPNVRPRPAGSRRWTRVKAERMAARLRRSATPIVVVALVVSALGGYGVSLLRLESHILDFFPPDHRVPQSYAEVETHLVGLTPFELIIEGPRDRVFAAGTLHTLDRVIEDALESEPLLQQALSPVRVAGESPEASRVRAAQIRALISGGAGTHLPEILGQFLWIEGNRVALRTTLTARTASSNACDALVDRLRLALVGAFPPDVEARITGGATLLIRGQVLLLRTQIISFALALAVVTLVIALAFRSMGAVSISLLANLIPILGTLGLMGWARIPLNTATVTVAGIALGLIVDDTIHLLHGYWHPPRRSQAPADAVADTLFHVGRPVFVTSVAVAVGFGAFALSPFRPTQYFGLLIAWSAMTAVACDLLLLPALLQWRHRNVKRNAVVAPERRM